MGASYRDFRSAAVRRCLQPRPSEGEIIGLAGSDLLYRPHGAAEMLILYKHGTRISRGTGQTIYIAEFIAAQPQGVHMFETVKDYAKKTVVAALQKRYPQIGSETLGKVSEVVDDAVELVSDALVVILAIRAAEKTAK